MRRAIGRWGRVPADLTPSRQRPSRGRGSKTTTDASKRQMEGWVFGSGGLMDDRDAIIPA